jgi:hypothetical protein
MADDRRIITGTHVIAKEGSLLEDEATRKWKIDDTVGKSLGGKSIVTDVANTQDFAGGNAWYQGDNKSTALAITGVTKPTGTTTADSDDVQFLYVRNLDTTNDIYVSLATANTWNGTYAAAVNWEAATGVAKGPSYDPRWDEGMYIIVPPGGSVQLRGDSTNNLNLDHVRFRPAAGINSVNIEYVLAE